MSPLRDKHSDLFVASLFEPLDCYQDTPAGEHSAITVSGGGRNERERDKREGGRNEIGREGESDFVKA